MNILSRLRGLVRNFTRDSRGATAVIVALAIIPIVGLMGFAIDVGNALRVQHALQASTDAAALAGAKDITLGLATPAATATTYSAASGGKNPVYGVTVATNITLKCFKSTGASCSGVSGSNGLVVKQSATMPTIFAKVFGINSFSLAAIATAGAAGAKPKPLNVMLVLDTTASMQSNDPSCSMTKIACAEQGVNTLLGILAPSVDQVGLMVFPGVSPSSVSNANLCGGSLTIQPYSSTTMTYQLAAPGNDFRSSDTATSLSGSSSIVQAIGAGGTNGKGEACSGMNAQGGQGTFFADAIWQAELALEATDQPGMQNVIVLLSDGDAGSGNTNTKGCPANSSTWCTGNEAKNQCAEAVKAAQGAATKGTWVFSIAYDADTSAGGSCSTDNPQISACTTMTNIASDSGKFYSDTSGSGKSGCPSTQSSLANLVQVFQTIGQALQEPRLLANNTT
ncbi:MAG TPA: TadE/TadG family type IV pilus assembly protein [Rhizomicrobium sp.]|nr:TadE/TadG family type IV pilus assembly protein [Rhizomicrobium sp.]